jgi:hypothetical protein
MEVMVRNILKIEIILLRGDLALHNTLDFCEKLVLLKKGIFDIFAPEDELIAIE